MTGGGGPADGARPGLTVMLCLLAIAWAGGCRPAIERCNEGTVFLSVSLTGAALAADEIEVRPSVDGAASSGGTVVRRAGEPRGSIEILLGARYREGAAVTVTVIARAAGAALAEARITAELEARCSVLSVTLETGGSDAGDGPGPDGPRTDGAVDPDLAPDLPGDGAAEEIGTCPGVCAPPMTMACGRCGSRSCRSSCTWEACLGEGVCEPMSTEPCGRCNSGQRTCQTSCTWGACLGESGCEPTMTRPCPGCPGVIQTCSDQCAWSPCTCPNAKRVFVTRERFSGAMGGLAGAHAACTRAAGGAGLSGTYRAWLSTAMSGPVSFMAPSPGPYALPGGEVVASSWADLVDGTLLRPINQDERGALTDPSSHFVCEGGEVWTNATAAGTPSSLLDCGGWTSQLGTSSAGSTGFSSSRWSQSGCSAIGCNSRLPIYCIEQ